MANEGPKIAPQFTREIPLNGRLRTQEDPTTIGASDFQVLQNMRYTDTHIKGIGGMTKINTAAVANTQIRSGIFFRKDQVAENFTLIQAYSSATASPTIYSCTAAPPATGSFASLYVQATAAGTARFSTAPGDKVAICDGKEALLYGGTEMKIAGFVDYDPNGTYRYDYTKQVTNSLTDSDNVATVHNVSGIMDANTVLLLHCSGAAAGTIFTDSSTIAHTVVASGATTEPAQYKFSPSSLFNSTIASGINIAATGTEWNFSASGTNPTNGKFSIDLWSRIHAVNQYYNIPIWSYGDNIDNFAMLYKTATDTLKFVVSASGVAVVSMETPWIVGYPIPPASYSFSHIELTENGNDWYIYYNGQQKAYLSNASRMMNYANPTMQFFDTFSASATGWLRPQSCYFDEIRGSRTPRHTAAFDVPSSEYTVSSLTSLLIGSTLPVQGIKFYVASANNVTGNMSGFFWDGTSWSPIGSPTDGTTSGGIPLTQTGKLAFTSTASAAKLKAEDDVLLYWYKIEVTNVTGTTTISQVTVDTPMQTIKDIWDGEDRSIASFQVFKASAYNDYTVNVFEEGNYDSANTGTFADISSLPASACWLYAGFTERMQGVKFGVIGASGNTTANVMTCEYFNGGDPNLATGWTMLSINDQTSVNNASMGQAGLVTWQPPAVTSEFKTYLAGIAGKSTTTGGLPVVGYDSEVGLPTISYTGTTTVVSPDSVPSKIQLYYYRFSFSVALDASTVLSYVAGIPAQETLKGYKFPVHHANRLWLWNNVDSEPNAGICTSVNTSQVFNGQDSTKIYLGNNEGVVAGASLYTRVGSNIMNMQVLCKYAETWAIVGETPENYIVYRISDSIGCVAPETMRTISLGEGEIIGIPRNFAIWESAQGFVVFDGANITRVSDDIGDRFDPRSTTAINPSFMNVGYGYPDPVNQEFHFFCVGAGSSTINEEWVHDYRRKKWFQVVRANPLTCAFPVRDTLGNTYLYGADNTGFVFRLENGNDMNGNGITQTFQIGDVALHKGTIMENTEIDWSVLVAKAKASATGTITVTHYGDGKSTGTTFNPVDPTKSGYRIVDVPIHTKSGKRTFHSLKFSMTTNDEPVGFEPLFYGATYRVYRREA